MTRPLPRIDYPELFFGLVAPIGTIFDPVVNSLKQKLESFGYKAVEINITDLFEKLSSEITPRTPLDISSRYNRYRSYIDYGNQLREELEDNSILALAAMYKIALERNLYFNREVDGKTTSSKVPEKIAYVIRQFKRPEEIQLMRSVYGEQFHQVSIYSTRSNRVTNLADLFSKDEGAPSPESNRSQAEEIVQIDQNETDVATGQRVKKTFHDADFIVNANAEDTDVKKQVNRFCELLFGSNSISPNKIEYGMKLAKSAALRSIDLSRQVGAAIFDETGQIISLGSNEVPKGNGGTYWSDEENNHDAREYSKGLDSNDQRKKELLREIINILDVEVNEEGFNKLNNSQMMDALEYGRVVHAEMSALTDASRKGLAVKDSILFCTTFPCHLCAKHIVSAGIKKVVFLEPYPKSLVARLHSDSIDVEKMDRGKYSDYNYVEFQHFHGITPRKFDVLFSRGKRKDKSGIYQDYKGDEIKPVIIIRDITYIYLENTLIKNTFHSIFNQ